MEVFRQLGLDLKQRWARRGYDQESFTDLATAALTEQPPFGVTLDDVYAWVQRSHEWVSHVESPFGNPITVFRDQRFYIEVLTWVDGTTSVHEHSFAGAFAVLAGSSIHARYTFTPRRRLSERLILGRTDLTSVELLRTGDIRPIHIGPRSAHALFHLARPSLSLVVRTSARTTSSIQYSYERSGVAYDPFYEDHEATRIVRTLQIMHDIEHPAFAERFREVLARRDSQTQFLVLRELGRSLELDAFLALTDGADGVDADLLETMQRTARSQRREHNIIARRRLIKDPDHRFFLALLLNVTSRDQLLQLVAEAHPGPDPVDVVCRWVADLNVVKAPDSDENLIGIDLDPVASQVFRLLLAGENDDGVADALGRDYELGDDERRDLDDLCAAFRASLFFGPLLHAEPPAALAA
jgi:hypothetical protein